MKSLVKFLTISLTAMMALSTFAFGQFAWTSSPTPSTVPSNAFISGSDDVHYFFQSVTYTATLGVTSGATFTITMPADGSIAVADPDGAGGYANGISLITDAAAATITVSAATASVITISVAAAALGVGEYVTVIFPVETDSSLTATGPKVAYLFETSDDLLDGIGTPTTADSVTFAADIKPVTGITFDGTYLKDDGNIQTTTDDLGEYHPGNDGIAFTAAMPDWVVDNGLDEVSAADPWTGYELALDGVNNTATQAEIQFQVWASQTAGLTYLDNGVATPLFRHATGTEVIADNFYEAGAMTDALRTAGLAEGNWYIYISSSATADWALAQSDTLVVKHLPTFVDPAAATPAWQYDDVADGAGGSEGQGQGVDLDRSGTFTPVDAGADDATEIYLDTGNLRAYDGTFGTGYDNIDIFWHGKDVDDPDATVQVFISSSPILTASNVVTDGAGTTGNVTALTGATEITTSALALDAPINSITYTVSQSPLTAAGTYYFYLVANDQTQQTVQIVTETDAGADPAAMPVYVKHSPYFAFQDVYSDVVAAGEITINSSTTEEIIISWGGQVDDARDIDATSGDPLTIKLYSVYNDADAGGSDANDGRYVAAPGLDIAADPLDPTPLLAYAGTTLLTTIIDTLDGALDNSYMWDIRSVSPALTELGADIQEYFIYAVVSQGGDQVVVQYNSDGDPDPAATDDRGFQITHDPFIQPKNPVAGSSIELVVRDNYTLEWNAFDLTFATARVQAFMAPTALGVDYSSTAHNGAALTTAGTTDPGVYWLYIDATNLDGGLRPGVTNADGWLASAGTATIDVSDYTDDVQEDASGLDDIPAAYGSHANGGNVAGAIGGEYDVWYFLDEDGDGFAAETPTKADGTLFFSLEDPGTAQNLRISPNKHITAVVGDVITLTVEMSTGGAGAAIDLVTLAIDVPSAYLAPVGASPFTAGATLTNVALNNSVLNGATYELDGTFDGGSIASAAAWATIATFQVTVTANPAAGVPLHSLITFADDGAARVTQLKDDNILPVFTSYDNPALDVSLVRPGRVTGTLEVEGRESLPAQEMSLLVVPRGSMSPLTDTRYVAANDTDADGTNGLQITMDSNGQYTVSDVPTGNYDVIARKAGFLDQKLTNISVYPGSDATADFTDGDKLFGGDAAGYDHDNDAGASTLEIGNNVIDGTTDPAAFTAAMATTPDSSAWNVLADITGDSLIWADDWAYMVKNQNRTSEGPVYTKSSSALNGNIIAMLEEISSSGDEVTYAASMKQLSSLRGYAVSLAINPSDWELVGYDDGLDEYYAVQNMHKTSGSDELFISATKGYNPIYDGEVQLLTVTVRSLVADPAAISIASAEAIGSSGKLTEAVIESASSAVPTEFSLEQNFPNPFNPSTTINFNLPVSGNAKLVVYNLLGQEVRTLSTGLMDAGTYKAVWNSRDNLGRKVGSGMYFYRLVLDNKVVATKKMLLMK
ncbi:carboxypeptidase regulatory-like domain-containing protein [Candidatus Neomarinimicrobiota bacterium]